MQFELTLFGITKDIIGKPKLMYELPEPVNVAGLKQSLIVIGYLLKSFPNND